MRRFCVAVLVVIAVLALVVGLLFGQQGRGPGEPGARDASAGPPDSAARDLERLGGALTEARLIGDERNAAESAVKAKLEARRALVTALEKLRAAVEDPKTTNENLGEEAAAYRKALAKYQAEVAAQDQTLTAKLSVRSQARCLAVGILDNGLGMRGRRPRGDAGGPRGGPGGGE